MSLEDSKGTKDKQKKSVHQAHPYLMLQLYAIFFKVPFPLPVKPWAGHKLRLGELNQGGKSFLAPSITCPRTVNKLHSCTWHLLVALCLISLSYLPVFIYLYWSSSMISCIFKFYHQGEASFSPVYPSPQV